MLKSKEQTQDVVANMLTESCDKNLLDSGYAYGSTCTACVSHACRYTGSLAA